jgi:hypothetical protein
MRCNSLEIRLKNHHVLYSAASPQRPLDFNVAAVRLNLALYGTFHLRPFTATMDAPHRRDIMAGSWIQLPLIRTSNWCSVQGKFGV